MSSIHVALAHLHPLSEGLSAHKSSDTSKSVSRPAAH